MIQFKNVNNLMAPKKIHKIKIEKPEKNYFLPEMRDTTIKPINTNDAINRN